MTTLSWGGKLNGSSYFSSENHKTGQREMFGRDATLKRNLEREKKSKEIRLVEQVGNSSESNICTRDDSWQASLARCEKQSVLDWTLANTIQLEREIILLFIYFFYFFFAEGKPPVLPWKQKGHQVLIIITTALIMSLMISLAVFMKREKRLNQLFSFNFCFTEEGKNCY